MSQLIKKSRIVLIDQIEFVVRKSDDFINASKFFDDIGKSFIFWKSTSRASNHISNIQLKINSNPLDMSFIENSEITYWIHPLLLPYIVLEYSPDLSLSVQNNLNLFTTSNNSVPSLHEKYTFNSRSKSLTLSYNSLLNEINYLKQSNAFLKHKLLLKSEECKSYQSKYKSILKKREHHKFQKGDCFYLWYDLNNRTLNKSSIHYKFGITNNINNRLQTERTICPNLYLELLIFMDSPRLLESLIKNKFIDHLVWKNHEYITNIDVTEFKTWIFNILPNISSNFTVALVDSYNSSIPLVNA